MTHNHGTFKQDKSVPTVIVSCMSRTVLHPWGRANKHIAFCTTGKHKGRPSADKRTSTEKTARKPACHLATTLLLAPAVDANAPAAAWMAAPRACFWETVWPRLLSANLWNRDALTKRHAPAPHCVPTANTKCCTTTVRSPTDAASRPGATGLSGGRRTTDKNRQQERVSMRLSGPTTPFPQPPRGAGGPPGNEKCSEIQLHTRSAK